MHIDRIYLQQNATQMLRGDTVPSPLERELTMYKCLVPAQNRLPNALVEEVGETLNNFRDLIFHNYDFHHNNFSSYKRFYDVMHRVLSNRFYLTLHIL